MRRTLGGNTGCRLSIVLIAALLFASETRSVAGTRLDTLLDRAGRAVEQFWQQVSFFTCTESVIQEKIGRNGRIDFKKSSTFDYLALTKILEDNLVVEELRLPKAKIKNKTHQPALLATNGFPTLLLVFHPQYRSNYRFQIEPESGQENGRIGIRFEHISGAPSTCALRMQDRIYPLELQGVAWIDVASGFVQKATAELVAPLKDINIMALNIEVTYKPQALASDSETKWLPSMAVIDVHTARQHWRNRHQFSQYKRFTVQSVVAESALIPD